MSTYDPIALAAYADLENAFSMAAKLWTIAPVKPSPEAYQATVATAVIHIKELRRSALPTATPQAGQPHAAATARPAPVPACPKCGGEMWDNRQGKKNPKAPDFKCKDKSCVDEKGFGTALWERDLKKKAADSLGAWDAPPPALAQELAGGKPDDGLPF